MCGFAGFADLQPGREDAELLAIAESMATRVVHRGPDDAGSWSDAAAGLAFGHRRLAVVDISPQGHQPIVSASGRLVLVFNGEIYNHLELRAELEREGRGFRGRSDTEVLLEAIEAWGLVPALQRSVGMVALALWDRSERRLSLARDRLGEKPLYFGLQGRGAARSLLFGSELKALREHPSFAGELDRDVLGLFLRFAYVPSPHCIFRGLRQLPPGHVSSMSLDELRTGRLPESRPYWSLLEVARRGLADPLRGSEGELATALEEALRRSLSGQMLADVPLGAFLSGGIDSSSVVAMMSELSGSPVRTFTVGFAEQAYDEAAAARAVAGHLGTEHHELRVTPQQALDLIPELPRLYDEPFADPSQVPTHLVARLARQHVTVALSGDGGDELFAGYNRYLWAGRLFRAARLLPGPARRLLASALRALPARAWDRLPRLLGRLAPQVLRRGGAGERAQRLAELLVQPRMRALYRDLVGQWRRPSELVIGGKEPATIFDAEEQEAWPDPVSELCYLDGVSYLPDDILVKVDRAAMAVSLETRVPLLDHRLVELAWRFPPEAKLRGGRGKLPLRRLLARRLPPALFERPKTGFGLPIDVWLRGPLRDWAEQLLGEERLRREGYLEPAPIREAWKAHSEGRREEHFRTWTVLMFQAWREAWRA